MEFPGGLEGCGPSIVTAVAWVPSLAPELPHVASRPKKKKKKTHRKTKNEKNLHQKLGWCARKLLSYDGLRIRVGLVISISYHSALR